MDDLTDDYPIELPMGNANGELPLIVSVNPGEYVIFPDGVRAFATKHGAEAISIEDSGNIYVLREGLAGKMGWVQLAVDDTEIKKEKKTNG